MSHSQIQTPPRPYNAFMLNVGNRHWLYVEEVGSQSGIPVIFLHGGPGSGCQHSHRSLFDQERFHAILFDQRGAGRSHPYLSRKYNTLAHQITDIEAIRRYLGLNRWLVVGGSWGSTLALAYAQMYPHCVAGLILRAVFLGTRAEVEWAFDEGPKRFCPDIHAAFVKQLPYSEQEDALQSYITRLIHPSYSVHFPAALVWNAYERSLSQLICKIPDFSEIIRTEKRLPPTPLFEAHYISHDFFMKPNQILNNAHQLASIPGIIVQSRYDLLCPPCNAQNLAARWKACDLRLIEEAGHAITEHGVFEALKSAIDTLADEAFSS
ncbi:MAG: prolyl aminopeptidase [Hyphomicrobium sp.]